MVNQQQGQRQNVVRQAFVLMVHLLILFGVFVFPLHAASSTLLQVDAIQPIIYNQGVTVTGKLMDAGGQPLAGKDIQITFTSPSGTKIPATTIKTVDNGDFIYRVEGSIINSAGSWSANVVFADTEPATYTGTSASQSFIVEKANTILSLFVDAGSIKPDGQVIVSGQLSCLTALGRGPGDEILIDFIEPDGTIHTKTTTTVDDYGSFSYTISNGPDNLGWKLGLWTIQARLTDDPDSNLKGSSSEVQELKVIQIAGYAILIGGGYEIDDPVLPLFAASLDDIYLRLMQRNFLPDDIYYMRREGTGTSGVNATTKANIANAITAWAKARIEQGGIAPLYIVLLDHGFIGSPDQGIPWKFMIGPSPNADTDAVTPAELNGWIGTLETDIQTSPDKMLNVIVINGFCYSGAFIPALSKRGRVVIASSAADELSIQGPGEFGDYFTYYLFDELAKGSNLHDSFDSAAKLTSQYKRCKICGTPMMDDNGDYKVDNKDGEVADRMSLGMANMVVPLAFEEVIETQKRLLGDTSPLNLYAKISDPDKVNKSWVEVRKPSNFKSTVDGKQNASNKKEWDYSIAGLLDETGTYTFYYYAEDKSKKVIKPMMGTLYIDKQENNPPPPCDQEKPVISPGNNAEINDAMMIFRWEKTVDPDLSDTVTYTIRFYEDNNERTLIKSFERIPHPFFYMNALREKRADGRSLFVTGGYYLWEVEAVDDKGRPSGTTQTRKFHVIFTNAGMGVITGIVLSNLNYANIAGSTISASVSDAVVAFSDGTFALAVPPGPVTLSSTASGYQTATVQDVSVSAGQVMTVNIVMSAEPTPGDIPPAGTIQLSAPSYSVNENGGSVTITATRTGGSNGSVGVSYTTGNGTATAVSDYTSAGGTLSWPDGDTENKTFVVSIINDTAVEADETFTVALSNPTGGATLGSLSSAVVTIVNDDSAVGDIDGLNGMTLSDAILGLRVVSGLPAEGIRSDYAASGADVNDDGMIGIAEVIYILQKAAELR